MNLGYRQYYYVVCLVLTISFQDTILFLSEMKNLHLYSFALLSHPMAKLDPSLPELFANQRVMESKYRQSQANNSSS